MTTFLNDDLAPADSDERAEAMAHDALVYELSVVLMRLDGNEGDPHQLIWCGGPTPEPWGDAWQKYEEQAEAVLNAIGEGSALALVEALKDDAWVARVVSSGPLANLPCLEWRSADVSLRTPIGAKLYARPAPAAESGVDVPLAPSIPATMFHDAGAIAQCFYCRRYTLDPKALSDRQPTCECGKKEGWSGSFKPPGPDAKWSGRAPGVDLPDGAKR